MCWGVEAARHPASFVLLFNVVWQPGAPCDSARYFCYCAMGENRFDTLRYLCYCAMFSNKNDAVCRISPLRGRAARALRGRCTQALDALRQISRIL